MRVPIVIDLCDRAVHVRLSVDHVTPINDDGRDLDDAEAPRIGNVLVSRGEASLQFQAASLQSLLNEGRRAFGVRWKFGRETRLDAGRGVE